MYLAVQVSEKRVQGPLCPRRCCRDLKRLSEDNDYLMTLMGDLIPARRWPETHAEVEQDSVGKGPKLQWVEVQSHKLKSKIGLREEDVVGGNATK